MTDILSGRKIQINGIDSNAIGRLSHKPPGHCLMRAIACVDIRGFGCLVALSFN